MSEKHLLVIETHNPYTAHKYEHLLKQHADKYEIEDHKRKFVSHDGEKDYRIYTRFKAMVTKDQETKIRNGIRNSEFPTFEEDNKEGYIKSQVRSAYEGVPFPFDIQKEVDKNEEN